VNAQKVRMGVWMTLITVAVLWVAVWVLKTYVFAF